MRRPAGPELLSIVITVALLAGCNGPSDTTGPGLSDNEKTGAATGAAVGAAASVALMAAGPVGIAVGAASGALKGNRVGNYLDGDEKLRAESAAKKAAATGKPVRWVKTDFLFRTEASGRARPLGKAYRDDAGRLCRDIEETVKTDDKSAKDTVVLCRSKEGWTPRQVVAGSTVAATPASDQ